jgi:hypothetical protein
MQDNPTIHNTKTCQCGDCQVLRRAMSLLGSRTSKRKAAASRSNLIRANTAKQQEKQPCKTFISTIPTISQS